MVDLDVRDTLANASVVRMASAAAVAAVGRKRGGGPADRGGHGRHRQPRADHAGGGHQHLRRGRARARWRRCRPSPRRPPSPPSPVQALASPELVTTARVVPEPIWARLTITGAATTELRVNTPGDGGRAVRHEQRQVVRAAGLHAAGGRAGADSRGGDRRLRPQRHVRQPEVLGQAEHQVGVLDRLAGRALDQVVDRRRRRSRRRARDRPTRPTWHRLRSPQRLRAGHRRPRRRTARRP